MAPAKKNTKNKNRGVPIAGIVLAGLLIAAGIAWFMFFRDTSPQSVDSVAAQEAREQAIQEASAGAAGETDTGVDTDAGSAGDPQAAPAADAQTADTDTTQPESGGETELDSGQPDSAASVGAPSDGVWVVDSSIGTFDDACLTEVCGSGFAGFRINEELAGIGAKTVVGRTPDVSGSMEVLGTQVIGATFTVDMTTLVTDNPSRTDALKGTSGGLETSTFPTAVFELTEPIELGQVPIEGVAIDVQATGNRGNAGWPDQCLRQPRRHAAQRLRHSDTKRGRCSERRRQRHDGTPTLPESVTRSRGGYAV